MSVGIVYDPVYLKHDTGDHVESAARLQAVMAELGKSGTLERLESVEPHPARLRELLVVHSRQHIDTVRAMAKSGGWLDPDTVVSPASFEVACLAVGGTMAAVDTVMNGEVGSAFALVRPPGHHATAERAMGFCLFNNIAVAARHAVKQYNLEEILIIDFDAHHGNGTQEIFYNDQCVFYVSLHQSPHYPGSGGLDEMGTRLTRGTTLNVPMPAGCGDAEYLRIFNEIVAPAARRFRPHLILVSAGYEGHWTDSMSGMQLSVRGYARMINIIRKLAEELCQGRLVLALEGGYELKALAASVRATFEALLGDDAEVVADPLGDSPRQFGFPEVDTLIAAVKKRHNL